MVRNFIYWSSCRIAVARNHRPAFALLVSILDAKPIVGFLLDICWVSARGYNATWRLFRYIRISTPVSGRILAMLTRFLRPLQSTLRGATALSWYGSKNVQTVHLAPKDEHPLKEFQVTWEQWGDFEAPEDKTILLLPSFSHGSHAKSNEADPSPGWWEFMIGPGKALDTNEFRIICPSFLGSPYGSTSPLSINPNYNIPYGPDFPQVGSS